MKNAETRGGIGAAGTAGGVKKYLGGIKNREQARENSH